MSEPFSFASIPQPNIGTQHNVIDNSLKSEMVNGCTITRKKYSRQLHRYLLHWNALHNLYLIDLLDFYQSCNGGSASFAWVDDQNVSRTVRFDGDIQYKPVAQFLWEVSLTLAEV